MSAADGTWGIEIATPMGTQRFTLELTDANGTVTGTATNNNGAYPVNDGGFDDPRLTFSIDVTAPFPLTVGFTLDIDGDAIGGQSKTGPFPPSRVTGSRQSSCDEMEPLRTEPGDNRR